MHKYLLVGMGGFAGAIARYGVGTLVTQRMGLRFPYGTFLINVSGCFLIGFFMHLLAERGVLDLHWLYIVVIGFIGAYTTFSTFTFDSLRLAEADRWGLSVLNVAVSIVVGLGAAALGLALGAAA